MSRSTYRIELGHLTATVLSDGTMRAPASLLAADLDEAALRAALAPFGQSPPLIDVPVCVLLLRDHGRIVLVDGGFGALPRPPGVAQDAVGRLPLALAEAGVAPDSIDDVLVTHLHPDHIGGLLTPDGRPAFPRAQIHVPAQEATFWRDVYPTLSDRSAISLKPEVADGALRFLDAISTRLSLFESGQPVGDRIGTIPLPGHTGGMAGYVFEGGGSALMMLADTWPHVGISFSHPESRSAFDADHETAVLTRRRAAEAARDSGAIVMATHAPWPSLGRITGSGDTLQWIALEGDHL